MVDILPTPPFSDKSLIHIPVVLLPSNECLRIPWSPFRELISKKFRTDCGQVCENTNAHVLGSCANYATLTAMKKHVVRNYLDKA